MHGPRASAKGNLVRPETGITYLEALVAADAGQHPVRLRRVQLQLRAVAQGLARRLNRHVRLPKVLGDPVVVPGPLEQHVARLVVVEQDVDDAHQLLRLPLHHICDKSTRLVRQTCWQGPSHA